MKDFLLRLHRTPAPFLVQIPYIPYRVTEKRRFWQMPNRYTVYKHPFDVSIPEMNIRLGKDNDLADIRMALHNNLLVIHDRVTDVDGTNEILELEMTDHGLSYIGRKPIVSHS
ncbi:MAG: hypothetical protein NXH70_02175 [Hyphomonas sp.]|nr:hypothetical protein [Hyphomonas sp.]